MKKIKYCLCILIVLAIISPAAAQDTIKIAAIFSLTGRAAAANVSSLQGVKNAVKELNGTGGVLGKTIQLLVFDNLSSPIGSHLAAEKAAFRGGHGTLHKVDERVPRDTRQAFQERDRAPGHRGFP